MATNPGVDQQQLALTPRLPVASVELKEDFGHTVRRIMYSNSGKFYKRPAGSETKRLEAQKVLPVSNSDWDTYKDEAEKAARDKNIPRAEFMWSAALTVAESFNHKDPRLAYTLENVASLHFAARRYDKAEMFCKRALSITEGIYGKFHVKTNNCLNNLAGVFYYQQRYSDAEALAVQVLTTYNKLQGLDHPDVGMAANNLGMVYHAQGKFALSELLYERALPIRKRALGKSDPVIVALMENYISVLELNNKFQKAEQIRADLKGSGIWHLFETRTPLTVPA